MSGGKVYGLLGRKLGHSWSVPIHQAFGCPDYQLIELEPEDLSPFLAREDIGGLNVTIPYKRQVLPLCGWVHEDAQAVGSANTIARREDGVLCAWNTDVTGFRCLVKRSGIPLERRKVTILGSGGASLAVQYAAKLEGAREIVVVSRAGPDNYENLSRHADTDVLVNATPVGMYPGNGASPVDLDAFPALRGVLDLIYNPRRTALLMQAEERGIPCAGGLAMLVSQAAAAEERFNGASISVREQGRVLERLRRSTANLVLIGMPGSGKTTVGKALAALSGRQAVDLDQLIAARAGCSIPEIFARQGEAAFRALEREAVAEAGKRTGILILTGGGVVKDPANYAPLRQNGRIYHLLRDLNALPVEGRPLSQGADLSEMWRQRAPLYERFRDVAVDNNGPAAQTAGEIWRNFCAHIGTERP